MMYVIGFDRFMVAGHDRGGRVACRMALDHPNTVVKLAVLEAVPLPAAWQFADRRLWPWVPRAQPGQLHESFLLEEPEVMIRAAIGQWGSSANRFPDDVLAAYTAMLTSPMHVRAIWAEHCAAAAVDRDHDLRDLDQRRRISCETLALWSRDGQLDRWYEGEGGAVAVWRPHAPKVEVRSMPGGHFFPEERPVETACALTEFFSGAAA